jgi:hypothetical protein
MTLSRDMQTITPKVAPTDLTATTDINGATIAIGARVRSFDHPFQMPDGTLTGFGLNEQRTSYITGVVREIGTMMDGCPRYGLEIESKTYARGDEIVTSDRRKGEVVFPPVNGVRTLFSDSRTCGVVLAA